MPTTSPELTIEREAQEKLRAELDGARAAAQARHRKVPGREAARLFAEDLVAIFHAHLDRTAARLKCDHLRERLALVAIGGFGRKEMAPYSDLDFMFLTGRDPGEEGEAFIKAVLYPLWNLKVDLGYCVHSVKEALEALGTDLQKTTAFLETHVLWGDQALWEEFNDRVHAKLRKNHMVWFMEAIEEETRDRHERFGNTVFLLEPEIKNSRGGLRDVHLILWNAFVTLGDSSLGVLENAGLLSESERARLDAAWSFLIDLRNTLHLSQKRRADKLTIELQIEAARVMGAEATEAAFAEEVLMRDYYDHAMIVERISQRLLDSTLRNTPGTRHSLREVSLPRQVNRDFWARGNRIWIESRDLPSADADRFWPLRYFLAAARENLHTTDDSLRQIEERLHFVDERFRRSPQARDLFLAILRCHGNVANTLRAMNRCGFLSAYIPEFARVRNLPRIDHYHQYTVDEHLIRSVEVAEHLLDKQPQKDMIHVAEIAQEMLRIDLLHLALLLHDIGKGEGRGHVILGMGTAQRITERMGLRDIECKLVRSLVANHQKMSHMALRRDIEDPALVKELNQAVVRPELLRMLYIHTCCDVRAVSAESWNDWRGQLLANLYERAMDGLRGVHREREIRRPDQQMREQVSAELEKDTDSTAWQQADLEHFLLDMPERYLSSLIPQDIARHFRLTSLLSHENPVVFRIDVYDGSGYDEITFAARDIPGLFSNLCGALASRGFDILSAQVYTASSGVALDVFQVRVPPVYRTDLDDSIARITAQVTRILRTGKKHDWTKSSANAFVAPVTRERLEFRPPRVDINNDLSQTHSVVEVRAPDRPGLLADITHVFDKFSINIDIAFIATESYQIVDVFYVTDLETNKLTHGTKLDEMKAALLDVITPRVEG